MSTYELPRFITLRSISLGLCVRYRDHPANVLGLVDCLEPDAFNPYSKIEVERAQSNRNFVHLRFCISNRYWSRRNEPGDVFQYVFATSNQPIEDTSTVSCTLFEPTIRTDVRGPWVTFTHVQNGGGVLVPSHPSATERFLYVGGNTRHGFRPINWEETVIMPKRVAFKGSNEMYLRSTQIQGREFLQFSSDDPNEEATGYDVTMNTEGFLLIRSRFFNKFWRRISNNNWIWADSTDTSGNDNDTLFRAIKVNDNTIALRNEGNDRFCFIMSEGQMTDCLNAGISTISRDARFIVEELVLTRNIDNVIYRLGDSRVYDEEPFLAGTGTADNQTNHEDSLTITVRFEDTHSYTFSNSLSIAAGVETSIKAGIPFIARGQITVSTEITKSFEWSRTTEETRSAEASYTAVVPPWTKVTVDYVGTRGRCNIPFSYTQRDRLSTDGSIVSTPFIDGVHTGVNSYNYHFVNVQMSRLSKL